MKHISISNGAMALLQEVADSHGVRAQEYLHALLHYAASLHKRPGSWEANRPFNFANYDSRSEHAAADRWFGEKP